MTIRIEVLPSDIIEGRINNPAWCPVAIALKRATGETFYVHPDFAATYKYVGEGEDRERVMTSQYYFPRVVAEIIDEFDWTGGMYPFGFTLGDPVAQR